MHLNQKEIDDLIEIFNIALLDTGRLADQSQVPAEVEAYRDQQARIRKWIHALSQHVRNEEE